MNRLSENVQKHLELFCERYPTLVPIKEDILNTYTILEALIVKVVVSKNLYSCFDRLSDIVLYLT